MSSPQALADALARRPRATLATLPTPLEPGMELPAGARLVVKRDDLTGLGMGGNKARKLEFLCGAALAAGADTLVTVGAAQSNHARMTAAAGARLGLDVHLVLGGEPAAEPAGNQLLARLFGARLHQPGTEDWEQLDAALRALTEELAAEGRRPYAIPMGGSTAVGALGFAAAWIELMEQCDAAGLRPAAIVHASSTGGTHAGLLIGRAVWAAAGLEAPRVVAVAVAKASDDLGADAVRLAREGLDRLGLEAVALEPALVELDHARLGPGYAVPTPEADAALGWAARRGGWVLDRVYTAKAFASVLAAESAGPVVFWHTGGQPAVFAPGGSPLSAPTLTTQEIT